MKKKNESNKSVIDDPTAGQKIFVGSSMSISHGSDDFAGGEATVSRVYKSISGGESVTFVEIAERPGHGYNWTQFLGPEQEKLEKEYKGQTAHPDPDIDTPWIESGDNVYGNIGGKEYRGEKYSGPPIW